MAQNTLTHRGTTTGYRAVGNEVRADAGQPRAISWRVGSQFRQPFAPPEPLGQPPRPASGQQERQERPEPPGDEDQDQDSSPGTAAVGYGARVELPGPSYGGAAYNNGGGQLANDITRGDQRQAIGGTARRAIESGAGKIIQGTAEDVL